jgi:TonB-linked SusC/RagA family outer membrane protein
LALGLAAFVPQGAVAQEAAVVTGQVTAAATGQPMAGVQVQVKGTTVGTLTDGTGRYTVRVPAGRTDLTFSFVGYRTVDATISGSTVNVALDIQAIGIDELVVTAMGVTRERRELGYSVQTVTSEKINNVPQSNLVSALSGAAAGVQVTSSATPGGTARIIIRGNKSIAGNNQPLFIVDGMPIDNTTRGGSPTGGNLANGGIDYGNGAADVDPNNIESVSILKGPNAAAIYGSRAANGAVVITTKSGRNSRGIGINASAGVTFESVLRLPEYQNQYGQGGNGMFSYVDGTGNGINDGTDESWGPRLDGRLIDQFTGKQQPWVAHPDNVRSFFGTGRTTYTNAAFARAGERTDVRLSVSRSDMKGMVPGNTIANTSVQLKGGVDMTERLRAGASVNYVNRRGDGRPGTGYDGDNFMQQFTWYGRQVDMKALKERYINPDGTQYNWNSNYHDNPYWIQLVNKNWDTRDRVIGNADLSYKATDWLTAQVRYSQDYIQDFVKRTYAFNTHGLGYPEGAFAQGQTVRREQNAEFTLSTTRALTPDVTVTATFGGNQRINETNGNSVSVGKLSVPGIYSLANAGQTPTPAMVYNKKQVNSLRGTASASYKGFLSVDVTGNNDWSSTLPKENYSYFYPSISSAFVFTDAFGLQSSLLSSGKVRASWARVGNDTDPYQLVTTYAAANAFNTVPAYSLPVTLANPELKPEQVTSIELGTDLGFFNERLGFVVTYYDSKTVNQILNVQTSGASGFTEAKINAGSVHNWGYEVQMNSTPLRLENDFRWDLSVNFDQNKNKVTELYGEMESQVLGRNWGLEIQARKGHPFGVMFGSGYLRDDKENIMIDEDGLPLFDPVKKVLGNYNPKWGAGISNRFAYKNVDLSVLVAGSYGGKIFSTTIGWGMYAGVLKESLQGRETHYDPILDEKGKVVGVSCDGFVVDGVYAPGTKIGGKDVSGQKNTTKICGEEYSEATAANLRHEPWVFDASFMKLREVKLGYRVPTSFVNRLGFSGMNVAVVGKNLALWSKVKHIDPEVVYNNGTLQGVEFGQFPTARSIGFTVSVQP